jgi:hypothetical protein
MRGILATVLLAAATVTAPHATAKPSEFVVYEIVEHRKGGTLPLRVTVDLSSDESPTVAAFMSLVPNGRTYRPRSISLGEQFGGDEGYTTYGSWPVKPDCPTACAPRRERSEGGMTLEPTLERGARFFVAGTRGHVKVSVNDRAHWRITPVSLGARAVRAAQSKAMGMTWLGTGHEHFQSASAPGGRYGSIVFGQVPCYTYGAGSAELVADNGDSGWGISCEGALPWNFDFADTSRPATWTLEGNVVGDSYSSLRLFVLDYPKFR